MLNMLLMAMGMERAILEMACEASVRVTFADGRAVS